MNKKLQKIQSSDSIAQLIQSHSAVAIFQRKSLTALEMQNMRSVIHVNSNGSIKAKVPKNKVLKKSISTIDQISDLQQYLSGDTILMTSDDFSQVANIVTSFQSKNKLDKLHYVGGMSNGAHLSKTDFVSCAKFKSDSSLKLSISSLGVSQLNIIANIFKIRSEGDQEMIVSNEKIQEVLSKHSNISENIQSLVRDIANMPVSNAIHCYDSISSTLNAIMNNESIDDIINNASQEISKIIHSMLNCTLMQCVQLCQILSDIFGIKAELMSASGSASAQEAVAQEADDPSAATIITLTDAAKMSKLPAVKALRAAFTSFSAKDALDKLNNLGVLGELPKEAAEKLRSDLAEHNVIVELKKA